MAESPIEAVVRRELPPVAAGIGRRGPIALVLPGGAARGAYEVGVVQYLLDEVARDLGRELPIDLLCGTSIGALNTCFLAAFTDEKGRLAGRLGDYWTKLRVNEVLHPEALRVLSFVCGLVGRRPPRVCGDGGGILRPVEFERILSDAIPFPRIGEHLRSGRLKGVSISTTHVASGGTVVWVGNGPERIPVSIEPTVTLRGTELRAEHAMASAAIPLLFPAVRIDGELYCEGGLRQNVPLSPALRLGAEGLVVVSPHHLAEEPTPESVAAAREQAFPGALFLLGKTLNALLLDRIDNDVQRLGQINQLLAAGSRRYGPRFVDELNEELGRGPDRASVRPLRSLVVRASRPIGQVALELVRERGFRRRARGLVGRILAHLAEAEVSSEADLLSYLLFDGEFARRLIELGRSDAKRRHAELCALFDDLTRYTPLD